MIKKIALGMVSLGFMGSMAFAASDGTDNAAQAPYNPTWDNGDDGSASGDGFQPWSLSTDNQINGVNFAGFLVQDSTTLAPGNTGANINSSGVSWQLFGTVGNDGNNQPQSATANATRAFDTPLAVGQTFSLDLAVNFRDGFKGLDLRDGNTTVFNFNIGGNDYVVNGAATGNGSIGNTYDSNTAFHLSFTQTSAGGGTWTITRTGGVSDSDSGTYAGDASGFHLYAGGTSGGDQTNLAANNLSITTAVPEPATVMLLGPALLGGMFFIRRRRA